MMTALEFLEEVQRYLRKADKYSYMILRGASPEGILQALEKWREKNPTQTRQSEFLKKFPNAAICEDDGTIDLCPCVLDKTYQNSCDENCTSCCINYWNAEV